MSRLHVQSFLLILFIDLIYEVFSLKPFESNRVGNTDPAIIDNILSKYGELDDPVPLSLSQGISYWNPPTEALEAIAAELLLSRDTHRYGSVIGLGSLRAALLQKYADEHSIEQTNQGVMVCAGANQAFMNVALTLLDPGDKVLLPKPYYFSHICALQLVNANIVHCDFDFDTLLPTISGLTQCFAEHRPKAVVLTNPSNPSGAVYSKEMLLEIVRLCQEHNTWLVLDEVYSDFIFDGAEFFSPCAETLGFDRIIHLHSFSKSYGLAGWRVGYMIYPRQLEEGLLKVQDTIPTHPSIASQKVALACLSTESDWLTRRIQSLNKCRDILHSEVRAFGTVRTKGAIYFLVPLPRTISESEAIDFLANRHRVLVTPGSAFGAEGFIRVNFAAFEPEECTEAFRRLGEGLRQLERSGT